MVQFAKAYPISPAPGKLSWSHYKELLSINDDNQRREVAEQAVKEHWTQKRTRAEVRKRQKKESRQPKDKPLEARPGKPGTYRIVTATAGEHKGELVIDLGFSNYYMTASSFGNLKDRDVVTLSSSTAKDGVEAYEIKQSLPKGKFNPDDMLFTYKADVFNVTDGDTFEAVIDLGFGFSTSQKLRLRGLDAPEILSADGKQAREWMVKQFARAGNHVLIKTVKSDKYDRYLADVWAGDTYLNQKLIDEGLAVQVSE